jgi:hypothetical protein
VLRARLIRRITACVALVLVLFASAGCSSCRGTRQSWVYAISRGVYSYQPDGAHPVAPPAQGQESWAMIMAVVLVLPIVIDTALLPVTIPHDLFFMD